MITEPSDNISQAGVALKFQSLLSNFGAHRAVKMHWFQTILYLLSLGTTYK